MTERYKIDIINLQEANLGLRKAFQSVDEFYTLAPADENSIDQSLLIIRKDLPLIPTYYRQKYET